MHRDFYISNWNYFHVPYEDPLNLYNLFEAHRQEEMYTPKIRSTERIVAYSIFFSLHYLPFCKQPSKFLSQFSSLGVQDEPEFFLRNGRNEVNHSRFSRVQRIGRYGAV